MNLNNFRKILLIIVSAFFFAFSHSQNNQKINKVDGKGKKQGYWKKTENGKLIYEGSFINDKPNGKFIYYYSTKDSIKAIVYFSNNGNIARTKMFHPVTGKLIGEGKYINEVKDSTWKFYDENQVLISEEKYLKGEKHGRCKIFYKNGQVMEEKDWKNGVEEGSWKQYYPNGLLKREAAYTKGFLDGKSLFYETDGKLSIDGNYDHDFKNGTWTFYKKDGSPPIKAMFIHGELKDRDKYLIKPGDLEKEINKYQQSDQPEKRNNKNYDFENKQ